MVGQLFCSLGKLFGGCTENMNVIQPVKKIDKFTASSILLDKLDEMHDTEAAIYLPDENVKVYNKDDVAKCHELKEVSILKFVAEDRDCDDFSAKLFGEFAGLVWTNLHALNWFIDEDLTFWWIEPQSGKLSQTLDTWQGNNIRFFVGR